MTERLNNVWQASSLPLAPPGKPLIPVNNRLKDSFQNNFHKDLQFQLRIVATILQLSLSTMLQDVKKKGSIQFIILS